MPTTTKKVLTDAEKNRQIILNRQMAGKVQGGVKLTNDPKVVSVNANTATGRKLTSITKSTSAIANQAAQKAGPATNEIIQQHDTVNGHAGDVVQTTTPDTTTASPVTSGGNEYADALIGMGFSTGSLGTIQQIINGMSEDSAEQRIQKKKAQEALQGLSSSGGAGYIFQNPNLETSSEQILNDIEAANADLFDDYTEEKTALEQQIEGMREVEESEFSASNAQADSARAATTAQFAQGQEGVVSQTAPLISKQFSERVSQQLSNTRTKLNLAQSQRDKMLRDLDQAYKDGNQDLADSISENLAIAGSNIQKMQQEAANAAAEANANALDFLKTDSTGMFAGMNPVDLANSMGVDIGTAGFMIRASEQKWNIAMGESEMNQIDKAYKIAQIDKMIEESKWAGMTNEQKNFLNYQNLLKSSPEAARKFAQQIGIDVSSSKALEQQMRWNEYALDYYDKTGSWPSQNGQVSSDGSVDDNKQAGEYGGQCGKYVNDFFGTKLFGDTLASKQEYINSDIPVAGGAFISKYGYNLATIGQTGHVGIVTKVYEDGSFDIKDSNRNGDEIIDTSHVTNPLESGIIGFFNPSLAAGKWNPGTYNELLANVPTPLLPGEGTALGASTSKKDVILSRIKTGKIAAGDWDKYTNIATNEGWLNEFNQAINDPKIQAISSATASKYGVQEALNQYQLDEILAYREQQGFGNKAFQSYMNNPAKTTETSITEHDKLLQFVQLREDLNEARSLYDDLIAAGGGLKNIKDRMDRVMGGVDELFGQETPEELQIFREIDQRVGNALVQKIKQISGVAVSDPEYQRLLKYNTNTNQADSQFLDQLEKSIKTYEESAQAKAKRFGFSSVEQMEDVIQGKLEMPSAYPGLEKPSAYSMPEAETNSPAYVLPEDL